MVEFSSPTVGAAFSSNSGCVLGAIALPGVAMCEIQFRPTRLPPSQAQIDAAYGGDGAHAAGNATAIIRIGPQRCALRALPVRLYRHPAILGVVVTCNARANVTIRANADATRHGLFRRFALRFGSLRATLTAGRPTVLVIKPSPAVVIALRTATRRHQRVSLRLTLTASSQATRATTTTRAAVLRLR
jgi:hypothetical protein